MGRVAFLRSLNGLRQYVAEVTTRQFPQPEHWFGIDDGQLMEPKKTA